jgi:hypothetical protein
MQDHRKFLQQNSIFQSVFPKMWKTHQNYREEIQREGQYGSLLGKRNKEKQI